MQCYSTKTCVICDYCVIDKVKHISLPRQPKHPCLKKMRKNGKGAIYSDSIYFHSLSLVHNAPNEFKKMRMDCLYLNTELNSFEY